MLTNTSPSHPDRHISKEHILQSKGLSHGLTNPHAVSTLLFRLKTAFLEYMHALINKSVHRRVERSDEDITMCHTLKYLILGCTYLLECVHPSILFPENFPKFFWQLFLSFVELNLFIGKF
jgi:hypothetical protein